jgi:hypothetical protein
MKLDWSDKPCVLIGGGPSLTTEQVDYAVTSDCYIMVVNNGYQICPEANALYACEKIWWETYQPKFAGQKYSLMYGGDGVCKMNNTGIEGIETQWPGLKTGRNGGYQALNLAVHFGCKKILLLGYDMKFIDDKKHWHKDHPKPLKNSECVKIFRKYFYDAALILDEMNIEVINCSRQSALECFSKADIQEVL